MPRGNLYAGMWLDINAQVDILTSVCANAPDFQIARMIKRLYINMGPTTVWDISGEALALLFTYRGGVACASNATIAGAVANNVKGRHTLYLPFAPDDALKPWDILMDTRIADYEVRIEFRDLSVAGTLFGSIGTSIGVTNAENYIEVEFEQLKLRVDPNGQPDALQNQTPLMRGIIERASDITQDNTGFSFDLPDFQTFRNVMLWSTEDTNANQTQGNNSVFDNKIELKDSQSYTYQSVLASTLREKTSQRWKLGSNLPAGLYELNLLQWGAMVDALVSVDVNHMYLYASVAKQANATQVRYITDTAVQQKAA
jgi:hypothetical protein